MQGVEPHDHWMFADFRRRRLLMVLFMGSARARRTPHNFLLTSFTSSARGANRRKKQWVPKPETAAGGLTGWARGAGQCG